MAIKTSGIDHIHLNIPSLYRFLDLMTRLFEFVPGTSALVHSIRACNASMRRPMPPAAGYGRSPEWDFRA